MFSPTLALFVMVRLAQTQDPQPPETGPVYPTLIFDCGSQGQRSATDCKLKMMHIDGMPSATVDALCQTMIRSLPFAVGLGGPVAEFNQTPLITVIVSPNDAALVCAEIANDSQEASTGTEAPGEGGT